MSRISRQIQNAKFTEKITNKFSELKHYIAACANMMLALNVFQNNQYL